MSEAVVIVNPTKIDDLDEVRRTLVEAAGEEGVATVDVVETTEADPGFGQTRDAVAAGARVVCPLGGDGTVRAVAQELVGTDVALGLLPGGTGNLLARNLGLPVDDLAEAMRVAMAGTERLVDVGWLVLQPTAEQAAAELPARADNVHCFTVMAGLGFDAQIMDDAPEDVKAKVGWAAYVAAGGQHLGDEGFGLDVVVDGELQSFAKARTAVVGNCGELTGGVVLLPEAELDDGWLDLAVLTPETITDWLAAAAAIVTRRRGETSDVARARGRAITVRVEPPQPSQVDGDVLAEASELRFVVQPRSLKVRVTAE